MSLEYNLRLALMAVEYAGQHLRGRSSNRPEDLVHTLHERLRARWGGDRLTVKEFLQAPSTYNEIDTIYQQRVPAINNAREERRESGKRLDAAAIIADGIGNCFEHAVLACHYLKNKVPCYMVDTDEDTNHVFVVIGVQGGLHGQTIQAPPNADPGLPLSTAESVVCDPWYHEWFGIQRSWATKMHHIFTVTSKHESHTLPSLIPLTFTDSAFVT